ncbi:MAG: hypothetical protein VX385_05605, partial [Acidobacteriota bacterium]|nr:hypothetical protein [Acidobacteriota bacterium]
GVVDYVYEGSGALALTITTGLTSQASAENLSTGGEMMPDILIESPTGSHPRRIPGAITDDRPLPRGR